VPDPTPELLGSRCEMMGLKLGLIMLSLNPIHLLMLITVN